MAKSPDRWVTRITDTAPNRIAVRGKRIDTLMGALDFGSVMYFSQTGRVPEPEVARLLEAVLVSGIDQGPEPPSAMTARLITTTGGGLNAALAAGILAQNEHHKGNIERIMRLLKKGVGDAEWMGLGFAESSELLVRDLETKDIWVAGFGHPIHDDDPRVRRLFDLATEAGKCGKYVEFAQAMSTSLSSIYGEKFKVNLDGAVAAVLLELGVPEVYGNVWTIAARLPGLGLHAIEEAETQKRMRTILPDTSVYAGPATEN